MTISESDEFLKQLSPKDETQHPEQNEIDSKDLQPSKQLFPIYSVLGGIETETIAELLKASSSKVHISHNSLEENDKAKPPFLFDEKHDFVIA